MHNFSTQQLAHQLHGFVKSLSEKYNNAFRDMGATDSRFMLTVEWRSGVSQNGKVDRFFFDHLEQMEKKFNQVNSDKNILKVRMFEWDLGINEIQPPETEYEKFLNSFSH